MPIFDSKYAQDLFIKELDFWGLTEDIKKLTRKNVSPVKKTYNEPRRNSMQPVIKQMTPKEQVQSLNRESVAPKKNLGKPGAFVNSNVGSSLSPKKQLNVKPVSITSSKQALEFYTKIPD